MPHDEKAEFIIHLIKIISSVYLTIAIRIYLVVAIFPHYLRRNLDRIY